MAATLTQERFTGPEWIFERKLDGIRLLAFKQRPGRPPAVAQPAAAERCRPSPTRSPACRSHDVILDGEVTWGPGTARLPRVRHPVARRPRRDRRCRSTSAARCSTVLPLRPPLLPRGVARRADAVGCAPAREGWEGVIAKRRDSPYEHRRSPHWLKMKCEASQELVVGGFTDPQGRRVGLGALLVGYFDRRRLRLRRQGRHRLRHEAAARSARAAGRARDPSPRSPKPSACRACARTGCVPRSSCRSPSSNGRSTASSAIPGCSGLRTDKARARSSRDGRDHASGEGAVSPRATGITKGELAAYYEAIAPVMLPHIRAPPVTMERYPAGIGEKGFLQKDVSKGFPDWLERVEVPKKGGTVHHPLVTDTRSLLWMANQNTITPHVWTSRAPDLYHPDICVFDLDPVGVDDAGRAARGRARAARPAGRAGLPSWVKTSGSKGFHIVVPLDGTARIGEVARFAHAVGTTARAARSRAPDAGVQQGRPRRAHPGRHRTQRLQRDVRRRLRRAREAGRAGVRAVHVGGSRARRGRPAHVHAAHRWPAGSPRWATCGRTSAGADDRCAAPSSGSGASARRVRDRAQAGGPCRSCRWQTHNQLTAQLTTAPTQSTARILRAN